MLIIIRVIISVSIIKADLECKFYLIISVNIKYEDITMSSCITKRLPFNVADPFWFSSSLMSQSGLTVRDGPLTPNGWTSLSFKETEIDITVHPSFSFDLAITHLSSSDLTNTGCCKENILSRVVPLPASWQKVYPVSCLRTWISLFSNNSRWLIAGDTLGITHLTKQ